MAMESKCGGCGELTTHLFAAQFRYSEGSDVVIICSGCWDAGFRCYRGSGFLIVSKEHLMLPECDLYWDEGGYVTCRKIL